MIKMIYLHVKSKSNLDYHTFQNRNLINKVSLCRVTNEFMNAIGFTQGSNHNCETIYGQFAKIENTYFYLDFE